MTKGSSRIVLLLLAGSTGLFATGCISTFKEVKTVTAGSPPAIKPTALAVGELRVSDARCSGTEQKVMTQALQSGIERWCGEHKSLELLKNVAASDLPPTAILLEGTITELEKGSASARFWVGLGAGQQRVRGDFTLRGPEGTILTTFTARKSYLGGTGIGGAWDMLKLEDLVGQLGEVAAGTTEKWLGGAKID